MSLSSSLAFGISHAKEGFWGVVLLQCFEIFLQVGNSPKISRVFPCERLRYFPKSKIYSFIWVKDRKAKLQ